MSKSANNLLRIVEFETRRPGTDERRRFRLVHDRINQTLSAWQSDSMSNISFDDQLRLLNAAQRWEFPIGNSALQSWLTQTEFSKKAIERLDDASVNAVQSYVQLSRLEPYLGIASLTAALEERQKSAEKAKIEKISLISKDLGALRTRASQVTGFAVENGTRVNTLDKELVALEIRVETLRDSLQPFADQSSSVQQAYLNLTGELQRTQTQVYAAQQRFNYVDRFKPAQTSGLFPSTRTQPIVRPGAIDQFDPAQTFDVFPVTGTQPFVSSGPIDSTLSTPTISTGASISSRSNSLDAKNTVAGARINAAGTANASTMQNSTATWPVWLISVVVLSILFVIGVIIAIVVVIVKRNKKNAQTESTMYNNREAQPPPSFF